MPNDTNREVADRITGELHELARNYRVWSRPSKSMQPVMGAWYTFRESADPYLVMDLLGPRDSEGNSMMEYLLNYHLPAEVALGLRNFFDPAVRYRIPLRACKVAVYQKLRELRERAGAFRYAHDVYCLTCCHSTFSQYHAFACGEDLSEDELISLAMGSDDPDQFIG